MIMGILLILCGVLIAFFPPLLALIVAATLIVQGVFLVYVSYVYKKASRSFGDPFIDFIFRL